jgi:hypothetical protein
MATDAAGISFDSVGLTEVGSVSVSGGRRELPPLKRLRTSNFTLRLEAREFFREAVEELSESTAGPYHIVSIKRSNPFASFA